MEHEFLNGIKYEMYWQILMVFSGQKKKICLSMFVACSKFNLSFPVIQREEEIS